MADAQQSFGKLLQKARDFQNRIVSSAQSRENILILSHYGADGVCASALLSEEISLHYGHAQIRCTGQPSLRFLEKLKSSSFDLIVFVDICAGLSSELSRLFGDRWLAIDHHEIDDSEMDVPNVLNCFQFGFDGAKDISSSGLCYFICEKSRNKRSAFLAICGALSDGQDVGPRRSLSSLNSKILDSDAQSFGSISTSIDLLFCGREIRPIHESIANTITCFIPGLTGNKDACLASLRGAGVDLKYSTRWKTVSDFTEEEKQRILEAVVPHLAGTMLTVQDLVGTTYTLSSEDEYSPLRDARDFQSLLNSCGRTGKSSVAVSLCLRGDGELQAEAERALGDYRSDLVRCIHTLQSSEDRIVATNDYLLYVGDGIVSDRMGGACCEVLSSFTRVKNKVVMLRVTTAEGEVKLSMRLGRGLIDSNVGLDIGRISRELGRTVSGVGGGLKNSGGVRFTIAKQQEFQTAVDSIFQAQKLQSAPS
jgi:single-stranded-DNA-specific exonuclease